LVLFVLVLFEGAAHAWGDKTHRFINQVAIETLRGEAAAYFRPHLNALVEKSVEPDSLLREREGVSEEIRHFIDLDAYMPVPFNGFPRDYHEAVRRFGKRRVEKNGVLPWVILRFERQLKEAITAGDTNAVVRDAAYLGHYVADAYQPLHLTENYDGQLSRAKGIHKRFEDGLVDANLSRYAGPVRAGLQAARPLADPGMIFDVMFRSYRAVDVLLRADRQARKAARAGSGEYYALLDEALGTMVQRQLSDAATMLGSFWLTALEESKHGR
jgi:hypothetical protein